MIHLTKQLLTGGSMLQKSYYSDYYGKDFDINTVERALNLYKIFCIENNLEPEVEDLEEVNEININHIMYHAQIKGMKL